MEDIIEQSPDKKDSWQIMIAVCCGNLGNALDGLGRSEEAIDVYLKGIAIRQTLVDRYTAVSQYPESLAMAYANYAIACRKLGRLDDGDQSVRRRG